MDAGVDAAEGAGPDDRDVEHGAASLIRRCERGRSSRAPSREERDQLADLGRHRPRSPSISRDLRARLLAPEEEAERLAQRRDPVLGVAVALEADGVHLGPRRVPLGHHERRHVVDEARQAADVGQPADRRELVDGGGAVQDRAVLDVDVAGEQHVVREDDVVADDAVVGDVRARHEQAVVPDRA